MACPMYTTPPKGWADCLSHPSGPMPGPNPPLSSSHIRYCCRKGDLFQGLRVDSCLTLGNELSKEIHMLTKQKTLLGRGAQVESSKRREPKENCSATCMAHSFWFYGGGVSVRVVSGQSSCLAHTWSGLGPCDVVCTAKMVSSTKDPAIVGCLLPPFGSS